MTWRRWFFVRCFLHNSRFERLGEAAEREGGQRGFRLGLQPAQLGLLRRQSVRAPHNAALLSRFWQWNFDSFNLLRGSLRLRESGCSPFALRRVCACQVARLFAAVIHGGHGNEPDLRRVGSVLHFPLPRVEHSAVWGRQARDLPTTRQFFRANHSASAITSSRISSTISRIRRSFPATLASIAFTGPLVHRTALPQAGGRIQVAG